jgi:hypothetical protein
VIAERKRGAQPCVAQLASSNSRGAGKLRSVIRLNGTWETRAGLAKFQCREPVEVMPWALLLLTLALDGAAAAALARANPARTRAPTCSVPYYTKREAQQLQQAQRALVRTVGGVLGGAACGARLHIAADAWVPLAPWASLIDATVDTAAGGLVGAILGVLWASEAALLRTGAAPAYMRDSLRPLMQNASADESLAQITLGLSTMASRGDAALRVAFYLTGLDDAAAVASIVEAAREEQAQQEAQQPGAAPPAEAVAAAYTRLLDAKLARARVVFAAQGLAVWLGTHGALWGAVAAADIVAYLVYATGMQTPWSPML